VHAIFDKSYTERYGNVNNGKTSLENVRERITEHMQYLQQEYFERFNIFLAYTVATNEFSCYACEPCKDCGYEPLYPGIYQNECEDCLDLSKEPKGGHMEHHANRYNIAHVIREDPSVSDQVITIVFIGHNTCEANNPSGSAHFDQVTGCAYNDPVYFGSKMIAMIHNRKKIATKTDTSGIMVEHLDENEQPETGYIIEFDNSDYERETVLHEFGHMFQVLDHSGENPCIYNSIERFWAMRNNNAICAECQSIILENANRFASVESTE
jgi:hypothetical protein